MSVGSGTETVGVAVGTGVLVGVGGTGVGVGVEVLPGVGVAVEGASATLEASSSVGVADGSVEAVAVAWVRAGGDPPSGQSSTTAMALRPSTIEAATTATGSVSRSNQSNLRELSVTATHHQP